MMVLGLLWATGTAVGAQSARDVPLAPPRFDVAPILASDTERALVQRRAASAVALGMGNVGVMLTDADVLFYNPAMLTQARGMAVSAQRHELSGTSGALASVQSVGAVGIGLGARIATAGRAEGSVSSMALTAGAARPLGPVRLGVAATYAREAAREATTVDVAASLPFGPGNALGFTAIVQHLGQSIARDPVFEDEDPWRAVLAIGGRNFPLATFWDLSAYSQVAIDADGSRQLAGGGELAWVPLEGVAVALRAGARQARLLERPLTGGLGLTLDRWSLDYAFEYDREPRVDGRALHRVGLRIR